MLLWYSFTSSHKTPPFLIQTCEAVNQCCSGSSSPPPPRPQPPLGSPPHILWNTAISWRNERGLPHTPGLAQQKRGFNHVSKATRGQVSAELSRSIKFDPFESCERIRSVTFAGAYIFINVHISQLGTPTIDWGGVISNEMQGESL